MAMRWLTREWQQGALPDAERTARWAAYLEHRDATAIHLPPGLHRLAATGHPSAISLHAAVPDWWAVDAPAGMVTLEVVCGDPRAGYQRALLQYHGEATLIGADAETVGEWLSTSGAELLYDEIDVLPGRRFEQRFLLGQAGEFAVQFADVTVVAAPVPPEVHTALVDRRAAAGTAEALSEPDPPKRRLKEALLGWFPGTRRGSDTES